MRAKWRFLFFVAVYIFLIPLGTFLLSTSPIYIADLPSYLRADLERVENPRRNPPPGHFVEEVRRQLAEDGQTLRSYNVSPARSTVVVHAFADSVRQVGFESFRSFRPLVFGEQTFVALVDGHVVRTYRASVIVVLGALKFAAIICVIGGLFSAFEAYVLQQVERIAEERMRIFRRNPVDILISYRRADSGGHTGRLFDRLSSYFGSDHVFMDLDSIRPGEDFAAVIRESLGSCDVVLAVIGPNWIGKSESGCRLADPSDFVRMEIEEALRLRKPIIPLLVGGAEMPSPESIPDSLAGVCDFNAVPISDARWNSDIRELIEAIERVPTKA